MVKNYHCNYESHCDMKPKLRFLAGFSFDHFQVYFKLSDKPEN